MALAEYVRKLLLERLDAGGWHLVRTCEVDSSWLPREFWCLESYWSPHGLRAWLLVIYLPENGELRTLEVYLGHPDGTRNPESTVSFGRFEDADPYYVLNALNEHRLRSAAQPRSQESPEVVWSYGIEVLDRLRRTASRIGPRKLRLFACACCRRLEHVVSEERNLRAIEAAEDYADAVINKRELRKARKAANLPWLTSYEPFQEAVQAAQAILHVTPSAQQQALYRVLEDVIGYPWSPPTVRSSWLSWNGQTVVKMAQTIYDEHRFDELPILADALEEALRRVTV